MKYSMVTGLLLCLAFELTAVDAAAKSKKAAKAAAAKKDDTAAAKSGADKAPKPEEKAADKPTETAPVATTDPDKMSAQQIADAVQNFYEKHPGFEANFTQVVKKKGLSQGITRQGQVYLKKADAGKKQNYKMRWDYPTEEVFYFCDGETLWSYEKRERLATKIAVKNSQLYSATSYLVGQGNLGKDFGLELTKSSDPLWLAIKLTPKKGTQTVKALILLVDKKTFEVRGSKLIDPLGDETNLLWKDIKYEIADDKVFEWSPPPGVQVKTL